MEDETLYKIMVCLNIEWSSIPRDSSTIFRECNCVQDWPQKVIEPESSLIFQASNRKSRVDDHRSIDLSQVCTDFRYSPAEIVDGIDIIGFWIVVILSSHGLRGVEPKRQPQRLGSLSPFTVELDYIFKRRNSVFLKLSNQSTILKFSIWDLEPMLNLHVIWHHITAKPSYSFIFQILANTTF